MAQTQIKAIEAKAIVPLSGGADRAGVGALTSDAARHFVEQLPS
jgi:hypothetical protein